MSSAVLPVRHALLALIVTAIWGTNFVVIKGALDTLPPLLFAALRFTLAFLPAALWVPRPRVPWLTLGSYGVLIGAGQFGLMFVAMRHDITPGLASLVMQTQVFFTIALAVLLGRERVKPVQLAALALATSGLAVIAWHVDASVTPLGLALTLAAALAWAVGNTVAQRAGQVPILGFMVWSSLFAVPPLVVLSLWFEGPSAIAQGLSHAGWGTWAAVLWQSVGNTLFGFGVWAWLLARYPAATVSPMALLVPVFGMTASALLLSEPLSAWKLVAATLVIGGLALNLLGPRIFRGAARAPTS
jgi:O-acetylserine/cysteine efflux transporter